MMSANQRRFFAIGALFVAGAAIAAVSLGTIGDDLAYYLSPTEVKARGSAVVDATVRLGGMVEDGTVEWDPESQRLAFRLSDGATSIGVVGKGAPPQMFRAGIGAVVEGKMGADGVFHAHEVIVKHDNGYQPPKPGERPEEMYKTLMDES